MKGLSGLDWVAVILTIVGGLNWGLVGFFNFNLVTTLLDGMPGLVSIVYDLVGLCALYLVFVAKDFSRK